MAVPTKSVDKNREPAALELVRLRNQFYRDNYRRVTIAFLLAVLLILLLLFIIFYQLSNKPTPVYFATSKNGVVIAMTPLTQATKTPEEVASWASRAVAEIYNFNFLNYRDAIEQTRPLFTFNGFDSFLTALQSSRNLQTVQVKKYVVKATVCNYPQATALGIQQGQAGEGVYRWKVYVPVAIRYVSAVDSNMEVAIAQVMVERVSDLLYDDGIAISSFVMQDYADACPKKQGAAA